MEYPSRSRAYDRRHCYHDLERCLGNFDGSGLQLLTSEGDEQMLFEGRKLVLTKTGTIERTYFYSPDNACSLESLREAIAQVAPCDAIGFFTNVYDDFGIAFETFVRDDQARRDRGEPDKPEPRMAEW